MITLPFLCVPNRINSVITLQIISKPTWRVSKAKNVRAQNSSYSSMTTNDRNKKVIVVGGGPAGLFASINLLRRGFQVDLYEKNPYNFSEQDNPFSYYYALDIKAKNAFDYAGLEFPYHFASPVERFILHSKNEKKSGFDYPKIEVFSVSRNNLVSWLLESAKEVGSENFNIITGWFLESLENDGKVARFRKTNSTKERVTGLNHTEDAKSKENGESITASDYLFLIGADGVNSRVRNELVKLDSLKNIAESERFTVTQRKNSSHFKVLPTLNDPSITKLLTGSSTNSSHVFRSRKIGGVLLCMPISDESFAVVLSSHITKSFDLSFLKDAKMVEQLFKDEFPLMHKIYSEMGSHNFELIANTPIGTGGTSTYCSKFNYGNILLIGDAAHSMVRTLAQGMNSAIVDSVILSQILDGFDLESMDNANVERAFQLMTEKRKEDVDIVIRLCEELYIPTGFVGLVRSTRAMARTIILSLAKRIFPWTQGPRSIGIYEDIPYKEVKRRLEEDEKNALLFLLFTFTFSLPVFMLRWYQ